MIIYLYPAKGVLSLRDPMPDKIERTVLTVEDTLPIKTIQEMLNAALRSSTDDILYVINLGGR